MGNKRDNKKAKGKQPVVIRDMDHLRGARIPLLVQLCLGGGWTPMKACLWRREGTSYIFYDMELSRYSTSDVDGWISIRDGIVNVSFEHTAKSSYHKMDNKERKRIEEFLGAAA